MIESLDKRIDIILDAFRPKIENDTALAGLIGRSKGLISQYRNGEVKEISRPTAENIRTACRKERIQVFALDWLMYGKGPRYEGVEQPAAEIIPLFDRLSSVEAELIERVKVTMARLRAAPAQHQQFIDAIGAAIELYKRFAPPDQSAAGEGTGLPQPVPRKRKRGGRGKP